MKLFYILLLSALTLGAENFIPHATVNGTTSTLQDTQGNTVSRTSSVTGSESTLTSTANGVSFQSKSIIENDVLNTEVSISGMTFTHGSMPLKNIVIGQTYTYTGGGENTQNQITTKVELTHKATVEKFESATCPVGTFNCAKVIEETVTVTTLSAQGVQISQTTETETTTSWAANGIGLVKQRDNDGIVWTLQSISIPQTLDQTVPPLTNNTFDWYSTQSQATYNLIPRYRLYNPNNGLHHWTTSLHEYNSLGSIGWTKEGSDHKVYDGPQVVGNVTATMYYRLYNASNGEHHWTTSLNEYNTLGGIGWKQEGTDGYIFEVQATGSQALYRLYNPNSGFHHYTTSLHEYNTLGSIGWTQENASGYVMP